MDMTGEHRIPAPRDRVWAALNDPEILRQAIPGCNEIEKTSDNSFTAKVTAKVGPVQAKFGGMVTLSDIDPPKGYTISGEGSGGAAGFAKGGATVKLEEEEGETILSYTVHASVGGKLAQIGSRLIDGTARKMAEQFFGRFAEIVATPAPAIGPSFDDPEEPPETTAPPPAQPEPPPAPAQAVPVRPIGAADTTERQGLHPAVWITAIVVVVAGLLWYFAA